MTEALKIRLSLTNVVIFILALLFGTILRISFLGLYPLIVIFLFYFFKWRIDGKCVLLILLICAFWIFSFRDGLYIKYNLVSLFYFIPFTLLVFAKPLPTPGRDFFTKFMKALTIIGIVNNIFGIIQYIIKPGDDNFIGIYGRFTVTQNGLSLLNAILFVYYFFLYAQDKKTKYALLAALFIICSVMGFYGAGMVAFLAAMIIYYLKFTLKKLLKFLFVVSLVILSVYFVMKLISPNTLQYNINILKKFWTASVQNAPRKLQVFYNYGDAYLSHPVDLLFGSGPGTFNSRSAFMVGSPTYFDMIPIIKSENKPYYFINYAYTLWNETVIRWYDGFMNQPFTSILALLGEYGLIFTFLLMTLLIRNYRYFTTRIKSQRQLSAIFVHAALYKFISIFVVILIIIDNYIEYPETIALLITIVKLSEQQLKSQLSTVTI